MHVSPTAGQTGSVRRRSFRVAGALCAVGLVAALSSCSGGMSSSDAAASTAASEAPEAAAAEFAAAETEAGIPIADAAALAPGGGAVAAGPSGASVDIAALNGRKIIREGSIDLRVDDAAKVLSRAIALVTAKGGFVAEQQANYDRGADINVVFRVPATSFDDVRSGLTGLGTVVNSTVGSNEVTGVVMDLNARLASKQVAAQRLRDLISKAAKPADVLAIEAELSNREAEIESMKAQLGGLNDKVSLSTLRAHIFTPVAGPVTVEAAPKAKPTFGSGWRRGLDAAKSALAVAASGIGLLLPFSPLILVAGLVGLAVRRRRRAGSAAQLPTIPTPPTSTDLSVELDVAA